MDEKLQNQETRDCHCSGSTNHEISAADILVKPLDVARITAEAKIQGTTRGQDLKVCPTDPLPLHVNLTPAAVNVSGDLVIDPNSCPVTISFANGPGGGVSFPAGTNIGITVPVAPNFVMNGCCEKGDKKLCKWSFTRTSP
jgi:hypothetical protein